MVPTFFRISISFGGYINTFEGIYLFIWLRKQKRFSNSLAYN